MPRLTAELIQTSPQFVNPLKERELDLRGNKIPQIENLAATEDQFDVLDLSDNDISKLENFPSLRRVTSVFLANNRLHYVSEGLGVKLPSLQTLVLTNNKFENLAELDALADFKQLSTLSLLKNQVTTKPYYRWYLVDKIPSLKILDFKKVSAKERSDARAFFANQQGKQFQNEVATAKAAAQPASSGVLGLTPEEKNQIRELISKAETLEEVQRLEQVLQSGKMPKELKRTPAADNAAASEVAPDAAPDAAPAVDAMDI